MHLHSRHQLPPPDPRTCSVVFKPALIATGVQDEVIQRFEDRCTEANAEMQQLKMELQEASKRLETAEGRLASTVDSRNKVKKQLEAQHSAAASMQASMKAESEILKVPASCSF